MNTRHVEVSVDEQTLTLIEDGRTIRTWPVSTAARGVGFTNGSFRTPTGRFLIAAKFGDGQPLRTRFESRKPKGPWNDLIHQGDGILTRILWLDGIDRENRNSKDRFIYIHGTNDEKRLGTPASHGCIRMANDAVAELFDLVKTGTPVIIHPPVVMKQRLIFFDCDSTLSSIEGIDELARARGPEVFRKVEDLTNAAMNGTVPIHQVFPRRMEMISPDKALCDQVARLYLDTITPGTRETIGRLRELGWTVIILSGGFKPLIEPLARELGIEHVEAVPLHFHADGSYAGYGSDYPTTRNGGKPAIIREWKEAVRAARTIMVGDGISDLESREACDLFIGYGGVITREKVRQLADAWIDDMSDFPFNHPLMRGIPHGEPLDAINCSNWSLIPSIGTDNSRPAMSAKKANTNKGKRYTPEQKQEVIDLVNKINAEKGRGGQAAAAKQFGISQLTISGWLKGGAGKAAKAPKAPKAAKAPKAPKAPKAKGKRGRKPGVKAASAPAGGIQKKLDELLKVAAQISAAEKDLTKLRTRFETLKASL